MIKKGKNTSKPDTEKNLLPFGFHDHIFESAEREIRANNIILSELKKLGFKLVRPAILEFEENLDTDYSPDFFKVSDNISGKMMVLRNDITPQICRIIRDKFSNINFDKNLLKISYSGQVFRKNPKVNITERQFTQTGFEIADNNDSENDYFTIKTTISILNKLKIKNYTINFNIPNLSEILGLSEIIKNYIEVKNYNELKKLDKTIFEICKKCDEVNDFSTAIKFLKFAITKIPNKNATNLISKTIKIFEKLNKEFKNNSISLDILEKSGFSYHSGLCYSFISNNNYSEIGRGGRYQIETQKSKIDAIGFTFALLSWVEETY